MTSRRTFVKTSALVAALGRFASAAQLKDIGVQLYTVRGVLPQKPEETLKAIRSIGYTQIEGTLAGFDKIYPAMKAAGLKPVSMHIDAAQVLNRSDDFARTADQLKSWGFRYAVFPYLAPNARGGPDVIKALAEKLNWAGGICQKAGLEFAYHNHAFEFAEADGMPLIHVLIENTDPKLVSLELDCFWVSVAGHDPVEMINHHAGRVKLLHLKDKAEGQPVQYNESVPKTAFKEVGKGVIDWAAVLQAAEKAKVEQYFVEQDQTPGDPIDSLRLSYQYLSSLRF